MSRAIAMSGTLFRDATCVALPCDGFFDPPTHDLDRPGGEFAACDDAGVRANVDRTGYGRSRRGCVRWQADAHRRARDPREDSRRRFGAFQAMAD
jgi:hypothetical protein